MRQHSLLISTILTLGSLATVTPALAQDTTAQAAEEGGLDDIIVTAERRAVSLQNAPVAVTALGGDALIQAGVSNPSDLSAMVPALEVSDMTGGKSLFYLRGVGNFAANSLSDAAVAFNFNDVYLSRSQATNGFFYDVDRVEVLKGPQGTLYGRNATGGAINVIPVAPRLGEVSGYLSGEYGNYDSIRLEGALNLPIGDDGAIRASFYRGSREGYLSDGTSDQDELGARLAMRAELTPKLDVTVTGDYFRGRGRGAGATIISDRGGRFNLDDRVGLSDPRAQAVYKEDTYIFVGGRFAAGIPDLSSVRIDNWGVSAKVNWESPVGTLTLIPAYRETDSNTISTQPGFWVGEHARNQQFTMEARLVSDDSKDLSYILGGYYFKENGQVPEFRTNAQFNAALQKFDYNTESYAFFGRLNYRVTPDFTVSLGGRYTKESKRFQGLYQGITRLCVTQTFQFSQCPGAPAIPFGFTDLPLASTNLESAGIAPFPLAGGIAAYENGFDPDRFLVQLYSPIVNDSADSYSKFTYRIAADWQVTPDNLLYASYETGFKSGGFFFSPAKNTYAPETIKAFTFGSKNRFFDNKLRVNLEAFHWIYSNQQISHLGSALDPNTGQSVTIFPTENVGKASFSGVEVEVEALVTPTTKLGVQVQYLDAQYKEFIYNVPANSPPQTGCATAPSGGGGDHRLGLLRLPSAERARVGRSAVGGANDSLE